MQLVSMAHWRPVLLQTPPCCCCCCRDCWARCLLLAINRNQSATPPNEHDPTKRQPATARVWCSWPCCFDHGPTPKALLCQLSVNVGVHSTNVCIRFLLSFVAKYRPSNFLSCLGKMTAAWQTNCPSFSPHPCTSFLLFLYRPSFSSSSSLPCFTCTNILESALAPL